MSNWFKRNGIHFAIFGIFLAICFFYFSPVFQGKALYQSDVLQAQGMQKEIMDVKDKTGKAPLWTNSMFGGMPAYQIWMQYPSNITTYVISALKTVFPNPVDTVLLYLLGAYFLFCVLKLNPWLSAAGAIAYAFSSYNFEIIDAGHANQAYAIAFFAPIVASIILTLRGKYLLGSSLTALFLALEIRCNHIQMTYYLMLALIIFVCIELYHAIKNKQTKPFFKSIAYLSAATILAITVNAAMLWTTYEYGNESIRGKSNLTRNTTEPSNGLDKEYAYQYSQGVGECLTFLIPNIYGGNSAGPTNADSKVVKVLSEKVDPAQAASVAQQFPLYWGDKPIIGGPWYFGAAICFLFVLGLLIVKNRLKWWLLGAAILSVLLSFGRNLPFFSDLFFNYFPLYNKFRTVESILVVAALCFPVLGFMAIQEIIISTNKTFVISRLKIAFYITGGFTLLMIVLPDLFLNFKANNHQDFINQLTQMTNGDSAFANSIGNALVQDRVSIARADAIRSFVFIAIAFGLLWALLKQKINVTLASLAFLLITLIDMWGIDKRYLKDENFIAKEDLKGQFKEREVDSFITRDTDPDFRVLDMTGNPFANAYTSYFHKSIGGYHAAKLKRYQEVIENQFTKSINQDVLDMLNTKYIITADEKSQTAKMQANATACGHAWFIKNVKYAKNADEEMTAISSFDPKNEAIVDQRYKSIINNKSHSIDQAATIKLVSYNPDHLVYETGSQSDQTAVFSEVYYDKGWTMLIDGVEKPYFRADYILRAAEIPVGNHKVEFIFHPASYYTGEGISLVSSILLVLVLGGAVYAETKKKEQIVKKVA